MKEPGSCIGGGGATANGDRLNEDEDGDPLPPATTSGDEGADVAEKWSP